MSILVNFPKEIFSEKELVDFTRRVRVIKLLRIGETWEKIKMKTGAHLQTIALVSKRLKNLKKIKSNFKENKNQTIFNFGVHKEDE